jgi:hypothetical protein
MAVGITAVLGVFFWLSIGPERIALTPHLNLEGKTWTMREEKPQAPTASTTAETLAPTPAARKDAEPDRDPSKKTPKATKHRRTRHGDKAAAQPKMEDKTAVKVSSKAVVVPEQVPNSPASVQTTVLPGTLNTDQEYSLQDVMDRFETDPSKYPLDRTVTSDGIAFSVRGLERREKFFVLKVAVANQTGSDFFIKDFTPQAGSKIFGSRSLFRILVEPQREREGYVIFDKPQAGAAVYINLKEDGGKGRVIKLPVPYSF